MDRLLIELFNVPAEKLAQWMTPGRYVTGAEFAAAGLAEMVSLTQQDFHLGANSKGKAASKSKTASRK